MTGAGIRFRLIHERHLETEQVLASIDTLDHYPGSPHSRQEDLLPGSHTSSAGLSLAAADPALTTTQELSGKAGKKLNRSRISNASLAGIWRSKYVTG